jgi:CTP synthase
LPDHPYFVACQFHPELKSRPDNAHPLFVGLVDAAIKRHDASPATDKSEEKVVKGKPSAVHQRN